MPTRPRKVSISKTTKDLMVVNRSYLSLDGVYMQHMIKGVHLALVDRKHECNWATVHSYMSICLALVLEDKIWTNIKITKNTRNYTTLCFTQTPDFRTQFSSKHSSYCWRQLASCNTALRSCSLGGGARRAPVPSSAQAPCWRLWSSCCRCVRECMGRGRNDDHDGLSRS